MRVRLLYHLDDDGEEAVNIIQSSGLECDQVDLPLGLGLPDAYLQLMSSAGCRGQFFAFADQDDIWHPYKLAIAVSALRERADIPQLWACRVRVLHTEDDAKPVLGQDYPRDVPRASTANAWVETIVPGCAMVWNAALQRIAVVQPDPQRVIMHDSWLYLVACAFGKVLVEPSPLVLYRLHGGNAIGLQTSLYARALRFASSRRRDTRSIHSQAREILRLFGGKLEATDREVAAALADRRRMTLARLWLAKKIIRSGRTANCLYVVRLLLS